MGCEKYKPTYILIAVNVAIYIYGAIVGGNAIQTSYVIYGQWGQVNGLVLFGGAYWQLLTSMFIHASIYHLVGNMLFLLIFGLRGEEMFSLPEFLGIYLLGGLAGNLLYLQFGPLDIPGIGASGAIFALFGACVIYDRRSVRQSILGGLVFAFFLFFINVEPGVNILAHLGGLVFGILAGYLIASRRKPTHDKTEFKYKNSNLPF
jgi:membrane associated rhomboid family serine protease